MPTHEYKPGDRVIYARGAKGTLIGKAGRIETLDEFQDPAHVMAMVAFDGMGAFPCWVGNLDPETPALV